MTAAAALAQTPDYFPLDVGNVWIYRTRGAVVSSAQDTITVEVTRRDSFKDVTYYLVSEYRRGQFWLRNDGAGRVWQYDEATGSEKLWYDFARPAGATYETALPTCCGRAEVRNTAASKQVALGLFEKVFYQLGYPGVFQIGITEEDFLPYVGLVYRSENIGGPAMRVQDLVYAKISGVTTLNASGIGFGVARLNGFARIFLNNNTGEALRFIFADSFLYDLILRDAEDRELYRWQRGKGFTRGPFAVLVAPGETSWLVEFPETPGAVSLTAEFMAAGLRYRATIPLLK